MRLDYTYRILAWVYSIRVGIGWLGGATFDSSSLAPIDIVGLKYGFAELRFRAGEWVRIDARVTLGVVEHFDGGPGVQVIIGREPGTHFAIGAEYVTSVGARGWLRLAWNTIPGLPMSFTLEATTGPRQGSIAGLVYLGVGHRFGRRVGVEARIGYATRDWGIGSIVAGGGATLEF
jgi:hypothetical protein